MPQASSELQNAMFGYYGSHTDEEGPIKFLEASGFTLRRDWTWFKPGVYNERGMTKQEKDSVLFLIEEWDFGGMIWDKVVDDGS